MNSLLFWVRGGIDDIRMAFTKPKKLVSQAQKLAERGEDEQAIKLSKNALELKPDYFAAIHFLGSLMLKTGRFLDCINLTDPSQFKGSYRGELHSIIGTCYWLKAMRVGSREKTNARPYDDPSPGFLERLDNWDISAAEASVEAFQHLWWSIDFKAYKHLECASQIDQLSKIVKQNQNNWHFKPEEWQTWESWWQLRGYPNSD